MDEVRLASDRNAPTTNRSVRRPRRIPPDTRAELRYPLGLIDKLDHVRSVSALDRPRRRYLTDGGLAREGPDGEEASPFT